MMLEAIQVDTLPFVMLPDRDLLPKKPCIYIVSGKEGEILYVGRTINAAQRWKSHQKYKALKNLDGVKISYLEMDENLLISVERALIAWFKPPLNQTDLEEAQGIAALRQRVNLTQAQLAAKVGVDVNTIRNWEKGKSGTDWFMKVARLCTVLNCSPRDLLTEEEWASAKL